MTPQLWVAVLLAVAIVFVVYCLADLARAREVRFMPRWVWAIICVFSIPWGGLVYLLVGKAR